jgi:transformation/transcription domain-associated protein
MRGRAWHIDGDFRKSVAAHTEQIVKRAEIMACKLERDNVFLSSFFEGITLTPFYRQLLTTA